MSNGNVLKGLLCLVTFSLILTVYYVNLSELRFDVNLSFFHPRRTVRLFDQQKIQSLPAEKFTCDSILTIGKVRLDMNQELQTAINTIKQNKDKKIWQRKDYLPLVDAFPAKPSENANYFDVGGHGH